MCIIPPTLPLSKRWYIVVLQVAPPFASSHTSPIAHCNHIQSSLLSNDEHTTVTNDQHLNQHHHALTKAPSTLLSPGCLFNGSSQNSCLATQWLIVAPTFVCSVANWPPQPCPLPSTPLPSPFPPTFCGVPSTTAP